MIRTHGDVIDDPVYHRPLVVLLVSYNILFLLEFSHIPLTLNMPHTHTSVVSSSHSQLIVIRALKTYEKCTMIDLFTHPLAAQLRACNSPGSILLMLQQQVQAHNQSPSRCSHERLIHYLDPTVNVLYTFSLVLEEGVGFVYLRTCFYYDFTFIFV
jgi:hypothetical protein